ncbi:MAG: tRNA lysidine(34) synthetase TilS [Ichthyobacteriaceae bacterium]|nr:tRNA lysidine(34) synthetase TilS [Ichthyobacteriaceae bacterium]
MALTIMIEDLKKHLQKNFNFLTNKKVLIGISGGLDSIILTELLLKLRINLNLTIELAHVNFKLRGDESDKDEEFVAEFAKKHSLKLHKVSFETEKIAKTDKKSIELCARDLRYNWFSKLISENNLNYIAVAHHLNDNVETILHNLSRGTGIAGITGMKNINGNIIRPLLIFSRKNIKDYAVNNNINWREDLSNSQTIYTRNKIRHELVPVFEKLNPSFLESFAQTIENLKQTESIQEKYINITEQDFWTERKGYSEINIEKLKQLTASKTLLREKLMQFGFDNVDDIYNSFNSESGKIFLSKTHRVVKDRTHFIITPIINNTDKVVSEIEIPINIEKITIPIKIDFSTSSTPEFNKNYIANLDLEKLTFPLKLRKWKEGDYFYPIGMQGKKKLSKYFKDEKYSLLEKENQWILESNGNIIWIVGKRLDNRFKVSGSTTKVFKCKL